MEFNNQGKFSCFTPAGDTHFISMDDINRMLRNEYLHDQHAHFIVSEEGVYDDSKFFHFGMIPERIKILEAAFNSGKTIVIKDLDNWNEKIKAKCREFKFSTNVHLYLTPKDGTGFGWHTDDRDVYIYLQDGEKIFEIEEPDSTISRYKLEKGSELFIPYGAKHRAISAGKHSLHLSFGVWPGDMTIENNYQSFPLEVQLWT